MSRAARSERSGPARGRRGWPRRLAAVPPDQGVRESSSHRSFARGRLLREERAKPVFAIGVERRRPRPGPTPPVRAGGGRPAARACTAGSADSARTGWSNRAPAGPLRPRCHVPGARSRGHSAWRRPRCSARRRAESRRLGRCGSGPEESEAEPESSTGHRCPPNCPPRPGGRNHSHAHAPQDVEARTPAPCRLVTRRASGRAGRAYTSNVMMPVLHDTRSDRG